MYRDVVSFVQRCNRFHVTPFFQKYSPFKKCATKLDQINMKSLNIIAHSKTYAEIIDLPLTSTSKAFKRCLNIYV